MNFFHTSKFELLFFSKKHISKKSYLEISWESCFDIFSKKKVLQPNFLGGCPHYTGKTMKNHVFFTWRYKWKIEKKSKKMKNPSVKIVLFQNSTIRLQIFPWNCKCNLFEKTRKNEIWVMTMSNGKFCHISPKVSNLAAEIRAESPWN